MTTKSKLNIPAIAEILNKMRCNIHETQASATIGELAVFHSDVCCDDFQAKLDREYEKLVKEQVEEELRRFE